MIKIINKQKSVSIWCDDTTGYISASVLTNRYLQKGYEIYFYTRDSNVHIINKAFPTINVIAIQHVDNIVINLLHHVYQIFLIPDDFSRVFKNIVKIELYGRFLSRLSSLLKVYKLNKNFIKNYQRLFKHVAFNFKTDLVISLSRVSRPYLFVGSDAKHIAILESWDHAMKDPWLFNPNRTMVWNKSIKSDVALHQGLSNIHQIYPTKFSYIDNTDRGFLPEDQEYKILEHYKKDVDFICSNKYVVYSMAFSDLNEKGVSGEVKFIKELIDACKIINKKLYIKPKPFFSNGLLDREFGNIKNVVIGKEPLFNNSTELLSYSYNKYRLLLVEKSELVIDIGSSFLLDSAIMGGDVLMIRVVKKGYSPLFDNRSIEKGHLKNFYKDWYDYNGDISDLSNAILRANDQASLNIKEWITHW